MVRDNDTTAYVSNSLNQYSSISTFYDTPQEAVYQISYDDNGNITASQRGNTYAYNWQNKLITASTVDCTVTYTYDALGRRSAKEVDDGQTTEMTEYCYNSQQVIAEFNGAGTQVRKYLYGPGIDEPIAMIDVDGQTETAYYYHFDGLGSVVALSDDNGTIVEGYTYDVFGNCIINTSAGTDGNWLTPDGTTAATSAYGNPYLYTGRRWEAETGLYYYRNRYYDPGSGRFISADPIGYGGGMNMYAYCGNNPTNWVDPMGLDMVYPDVPSGSIDNPGIIGPFFGSVWWNYCGAVNGAIGYGIQGATHLGNCGESSIVLPNGVTVPLGFISDVSTIVDTAIGEPFRDSADNFFEMSHSDTVEWSDGINNLIDDLRDNFNDADPKDTGPKNTGKSEGGGNSWPDDNFQIPTTVEEIEWIFGGGQIW